MDQQRGMQEHQFAPLNAENVCDANHISFKLNVLLSPRTIEHPTFNLVSLVLNPQRDRKDGAQRKIKGPKRKEIAADLSFENHSLF